MPEGCSDACEIKRAPKYVEAPCVNPTDRGLLRKKRYLVKATLKACIEAGLFDKAMNSKTESKKTSAPSDKRKLKTCSLKVKYRLKTKKLYPKSVAKDNAEQIEQACIKSKFNAKRSFAMVKRYFSKKRPSSSIRKGKRVNRGEASSSKGRLSAKRNNQPAAPASKMKQCKAAVWDIAKNRQLRPVKGKSAVNKRILEACRLNAYSADSVFKKLEKLFSDGSDSTVAQKVQQGPLAKEKAGNSASTIPNHRSLSTQALAQKTTQPQSAKYCQSQVEQWAAKKNINALRELDRKTRQLRIRQACKKAMNDALKAQSYLR